MIKKDESRSINELQKDVFNVPKYKRYVSLSGWQVNGNKKVITYICRGPNRVQIPFDVFDGFKPELEKNSSLKIIIVSDNMELSCFKLNQTLNNYSKKNLLQFEVIPVDKYEQDELERVKEYKEKMKTLSGGYSKGEIDNLIKMQLKKNRKLSPQEISLDKQVRLLLENCITYEDKLIDTEDLDIDYLQNAPKGWPKDLDLPKEVLSIIGEEYPKSVLADGVNHNEDLYNDKEIKTKIGNGRAWPIPSLIGNLIFFSSYKDIHNTLESCVQNSTGLPFVFDKSGGYGGVGVYRHLHAYAGLALREEKPNTVYLEIYGSLLAVKGFSFAQLEYEEYLLRKYHEEGKLFIPEGPLVVQILQATLSNYSFPGIGIPLYL